MNPTAILHWINDNHFLAVTVGWPLLSGLFNMMTRYQSVDDWIKLGESKPRTAHFIRFVRATGLDPKKALESLISFVNHKAEKSVAPAAPPAVVITDATPAVDAKEEITKS